VVRLAAAGLSLDGHCMQYGSGPVDVSDPPSVSAAVGERECVVSCSALHAACSAGLFSPSASIACDDVLRRGWCSHRCAVSPPLPPPRVHRSLHPHVSLVASIEPGSRVGALRLMCVCAAGVAVELPRRRGRDDISWRAADAVRLAVVDAPRCDVQCERAAVRGDAEVRGDGAHRDP
jgi:hypothetical protein